jgi:hypothetical protein
MASLTHILPWDGFLMIKPSKTSSKFLPAWGPASEDPKFAQLPEVPVMILPCPSLTQNLASV